MEILKIQNANGMNPRRLALEIFSATAVILAAVKILYAMRASPFLNAALSGIVALIFVYAPVVILWVKKRPIDFLDHGLKNYARSAVVFLITALVVFPPFCIATHGWKIFVEGYQSFHAAPFPKFLNVAAFQILLVALPEEFFFRGYFQSAAFRIWPARWRIFGANLGWGWIITAAVFALAHSVVTYQWWHFSIFFPALVFGWLREKTGTITAAFLFHAASNLIMDWLVRSYV